MQAMVDMAKNRTELSQKRTKMAAKRTKLAAERTYMNYERTLSVWIRTALAIMIFGIAIDRLGLMYHVLPAGSLKDSFLQLHTPSTVTGVVLVIFSMLMALFSGIRFIFLMNRYKEEYDFSKKHKTWLPTVYAFMVVLFGAALLVLMLWID